VYDDLVFILFSQIHTGKTLSIHKPETKTLIFYPLNNLQKVPKNPPSAIRQIQNGVHKLMKFGKSDVKLPSSIVRCSSLNDHIKVNYFKNFLIKP